jgi:L-serine deaminase
MPTESDDLAAAVESLAQTKVEHRQILTVISGDAGMAPETRRTLVAHLLEEEDEHVARIRILTGGAGSAASASTASTPSAAQAAGGRALSVGSLRGAVAPPAAAPGLSVGSLRID